MSQKTINQQIGSPLARKLLAIPSMPMVTAIQQTNFESFHILTRHKNIPYKK